ncbi:MAG: SDR family oxidoreductase [candidate division NC10 bacterium]|nr:SDR family oxidoreductase [candidate division NC10 bacterium]
MSPWDGTGLYETDGPVVRVTLNRPERRNALDDVLIEELDEAVKQADLDEAIRVIIIAGAGKSFSAGHDISGPAPNMEAGGRKARSREAQTTWKDPERRLKREQFLYFDKSLAIRNTVKPTIAQVQGPCVAAGLMLAFMCDLFANAGFSRLVPFLDITAEQWQRMIDVNLTGTFSVCQAVARQMVAQKKGGRMIVTASVMADFNGNQQAHYCAAKAGVKLLGKCMAAELGNHRITVNVISPGVIATEMTTPLLEEAGIANMVRAITPLGRWGEAREVGRLVAFLASDDAAYINGQVINVDGGQSLPLVPPWRPLDYTEPHAVDWDTPRQRYPFFRS